MLTPRDKRAVLRQHTLLRMAQLIDAPPYHVGWVPKGTKPPTGGWRFNPAESRNEIVLNECLDELAEKPGIPARLALKTYLHEVAHSLWSERDFRELGARLDEAGVPFTLYNLFEDARIEAKWRRDMKQRFQWTQWNPPAWETRPLPSLAPEEIFLGLITVENSRMATRQLLDLAAAAGPEQVDRAGKIMDFFRRATRKGSRYVKTSLDLVPLCEEWLKHFPWPKSEEEQWRPVPGHHHGDDYRGSVEMAEAEGQSVLWDDTAELPEIIRDWNGKARAILWSPGCNQGEFDPRLGRRFETVVSRSLPGGWSVVKSVTPGKRVSIKDYARAADKVYRTRRENDDGVSRVALVIDCSGSMWKAPHVGGLTLLQVLNHLHRKGQLEANVFLTFGLGAVELPLPFSDEILFNLDCDGPSEGIEFCFEKYRDVLCRADVVSVYTDGQITDDPFDRAKWRRQGIETYGLYVGKNDKIPMLKMWFDHALVRSSIEQLIVAWAKLLQRRQG